MTEGLDHIKKRDINSAIEMIQNQNTHSEFIDYYLIEYNSKRYNLRQVISGAFEQQLDTLIQSIYDIKDCLEIAEKLDFRVEQGASCWKVGCNWGSGAPSFYTEIKEHSIILGVDFKIYNLGDLILVSEGFSVRGLGRIINRGKYLKENIQFSELFMKYEILNQEEVLYYEIEFYELSKIETFTYQLQQGIVEVRNHEIICNALNIWDSKGYEPLKNTFRLVPSAGKLKYDGNYPCLGLVFVNWDDFTFKTSFNLIYFLAPNKFIELGTVKIFQHDKKRTEISDFFKQLDPTYCSLGAELDYYTRLVDLFPTDYPEVLKSLRDMAYDSEIKSSFINEDGVQASLLRNSDSLYILDALHEILSPVKKDKPIEFNFELQIGDASTPHRVKFQFGKHLEIEQRFFCLIGKNATGKTRFLAGLANKLVNTREGGNFFPKRPNLSKVIVASFSFFDRFRFPKRNERNYVFIGIRDSQGKLLISDDYSDRIWKSYRTLTKDKKKADLWIEAIENSLETDYLGFPIKSVRLINTKEEFISKTEDIFSSGQNIIFQFITRLIEHIDYNSIIIFDEPETHLHPNIAGRLIRTLNKILTDYKSFCVLATHSPVIVQEIASRQIRIFDRKENTPIIFEPPIECLGENLSEINSVIFKVDQEKELYKQQLDKLLNSGKTIEQVNALFDNRLSLNARIFLLTSQRSNND